jgi:hypothetical protein
MSDYIYQDPKENEPALACVKLIINEVEYFIPCVSWDLAIAEGRTKPVIYGERIKMVTEEDYNELLKLQNWNK